MDWSDVAKQLISLGAPLLGTALGGPLGGAAGRILADAIGASSPTPEAVGKALPGCDFDLIARAEASWAETIRAEAETQRIAIAEAQQTIRAEIASDDPVQKYWRPLYAFELVFECAALWSIVVWSFWAGDTKTINALTNASALLISYWGFRFGVLGVYVSGRTREKVSAATGQDVPSTFDRLVKAVVKKK